MISMRAISVNKGFLLLPVVLTLAILAAVAFLLTREGAMNAGLVKREQQQDTALYAAKAGLNHAMWTLNRQNCTGYTDIPSTNFGDHNYLASYTDTNGTTLAAGSPANIKVVGTEANGASYTIQRYREKVYQTTLATLELQPDAAAGKDTYLSSWKSTWNYGVSGSIWADSESRGLLQFDLSSLPAQAKIQTAILELYQSDPSAWGGKVSVHRVTNSWVEGIKNGSIGVPNWTQKETGINWTSAGGDYDAIPVAATVIASGGGLSWYNWDITSLVQSWGNNLYPNEGITLLPISGAEAYFSSSDASTAANRPKLTITYTCECGQSCDVAPPVTFCEADYTPNTKLSEYSSSAIGAADAQAITYLPEGVTFNGVTSPAGGAWVLIDPVDSRFYMTDMAGSLLTSIEIPISFAHGVVFISSGIYANHIALTNTSGGLMYVNMNGIDVSGILASGSAQAAGIGFIGTSSSGTYDDHIMVLDRSSETVLIRTQAGAAVSSFSVNDGTSMPVQDVNHLPGSDKVIVTYDPNKAVIYDFTGTKLREYSLAGFGATLAESTAINPLTCEHVVADRGSDRVIALNFADTLPSGVVFEEFTEIDTGGTSITINKPAGTVLDDLLIAAVATDGNTAITPPAGWTVINIADQSGAVSFGVWWKVAGASEPGNYTFIWSGGSEQVVGWIMRFTGHDPVNPINTSATTGGSSDTPSSPSVTTTVDNALILRLGAFDDDDTTPGAPGLPGHTVINMRDSGQGPSTVSGGSGYIMQATAGISGTSSFSLTAAEQYVTITIGIAPEP